MSWSRGGGARQGWVVRTQLIERSIQIVCGVICGVPAIPSQVTRRQRHQQKFHRSMARFDVHEVRSWVEKLADPSERWVRVGIGGRHWW